MVTLRPCSDVKVVFSLASHDEGSLVSRKIVRQIDHAVQQFCPGTHGICRVHEQEPFLGSILLGLLDQCDDVVAVAEANDFGNFVGPVTRGR